MRMRRMRKKDTRKISNEEQSKKNAAATNNYKAYNINDYLYHRLEKRERERPFNEAVKSSEKHSAGLRGHAILPRATTFLCEERNTRVDGVT